MGNLCSAIFFFSSMHFCLFLQSAWYVHQLVFPFSPTNRAKKRIEKRKSKEVRGVIHIFNGALVIYLTVKRQSTNLAIAPSMFIHKRAMRANPLPTTRTRACACRCACPNWTRTGLWCRRFGTGPTARGTSKRRRINPEIIEWWCRRRVGTTVGYLKTKKKKKKKKRKLVDMDCSKRPLGKEKAYWKHQNRQWWATSAIHHLRKALPTHECHLGAHGP